MRWTCLILSILAVMMTGCAAQKSEFSWDVNDSSIGEISKDSRGEKIDLQKGPDTKQITGTAEMSSQGKGNSNIKKSTIGISNVTDSFDNTSDSFILYDFVKKSFSAAPAIEVMLTDNVSEADYAVAGFIESNYSALVVNGGGACVYDMKYTFANNATFKIYGGGKKLDTLTLQCNGNYTEECGYGVDPGFRSRSLQQCFKTLVDSLTKFVGQPGERKL